MMVIFGVLCGLDIDLLIISFSAIEVTDREWAQVLIMEAFRLANDCGNSMTEISKCLHIRSTNSQQRVNYSTITKCKSSLRDQQYIRW